MGFTEVGCEVCIAGFKWEAVGGELCVESLRLMKEGDLF
jgi:hypothetical protein